MWHESSSVKAVNLLKKSFTVTEIMAGLFPSFLPFSRKWQKALEKSDQSLTYLLRWSLNILCSRWWPKRGRGGTKSDPKAAVNEIHDSCYGRFRLIHEVHNIGPILVGHWYNIIFRNSVNRILVRHRIA